MARSREKKPPHAKEQRKEPDPMRQAKEAARPAEKVRDPVVGTPLEPKADPFHPVSTTPAESERHPDAVPAPVESSEIPAEPVAGSDSLAAPRQEQPLPEPPESGAPTPHPAAPEAPPPAPRHDQPPLLFEVGWEVCWQLGGIYTVLRTKAATMLQRWGDRYTMIGPYNPTTAALEFEEQPTEGFVRETLDRLRDQGIPCHYGRWLIPGRPRVILLDYRARYKSLDFDKYLLWQDHGISTPTNDGEVNEVVAFGFTVAEFFRELSNVVTDRAVLAHFHEWMAGVAVPRIAHLRLPVSTVFTTHATLLGRYLAGDNPEFYNHLPFLDAEAEAQRYGIYPRHQIEKAAAHASAVFTTVSEVTATEAQKLLGRVPDAILPNGINLQRFAAMHEFQNLHRQYKERIHEFVTGHFFPSYTFDLDRTIYLFTSGRYEYRNKGMDLFIEAMYRLNQRLKLIPDPPTVVSFIITKAAVRNVNVAALQNHSMFEDLRSVCHQIRDEMGQRLFQAATTGRIPGYQELLTEDATVRLKRAIHAWRTSRQPLITTHDLEDDAHDPVLNHLRHRHLFNAADDPVKVIFHPQFITATSPVISLDYEQFVRGCHMGVFPSYYEPWGYTPMESVALGLPAVTTDLSGFGAYVKRNIPDADQNGILVLNRRTQSFERTTEDLAGYLFEFAQLNRRQRIEQRNRVERMSELFDWPNLIRHYDEAYNLARDRSGARDGGRVDVRVI